ncbi:hypothetical protein D3C79_929260 [compost metagenome]
MFALDGGRHHLLSAEWAGLLFWGVAHWSRLYCHRRGDHYGFFWLLESPDERGDPADDGPAQEEVENGDRLKIALLPDPRLKCRQKVKRRHKEKCAECNGYTKRVQRGLSAHGYAVGREEGQNYEPDKEHP